MMGEILDPRIHFVVATCIVAKDGPFDAAQGGGRKPPMFLIAKRAAHEKVHPNRWTVPGGKLVRHEYKHLPQLANQWYNVVQWVVEKEVKEEVGLEIGRAEYVCDLAFVRPDGYPVVILSYWAPWKSGEVKLGKDLTDFAWITADEAKNFDLIEGIDNELAAVAKILAS
jgi:8-oxo-dGTP pyrophosphatase MutT (NUDIX family)